MSRYNFGRDYLTPAVFGIGVASLSQPIIKSRIRNQNAVFALTYSTSLAAGAIGYGLLHTEDWPGGRATPNNGYYSR